MDEQASDGPDKPDIDTDAEMARLAGYLRRVAGGALTDPPLPNLSFSVDDLRSVEEKLWHRFQTAEPALGDERPHIRMVAWAWAGHAFRQMHAAFTLYRAGLVDAAFPNARTTIEHGVYLSVLANSNEPEKILNEAEFGFMGKIDMLIEHDWLSDDQVAAINELRSEIPPPTSRPTMTWARKIEQMCDRVETGDAIYQIYRMISEHVHPGFASGVSLLVPLFIDGHLTTDPSEMTIVEGLWMAIGGASWAGWAYDKIFAEDWFGPLLDDVVKPLRFIPLAHRPVKQRPASKRRWTITCGPEALDGFRSSLNGIAGLGTVVTLVQRNGSRVDGVPLRVTDEQVICAHWDAASGSQTGGTFSLTLSDVLRVEVP